MKILIISYLFPPVGGGGVQRVKTLAEFLLSKGSDVSVYTESVNRYKYDAFDFNNSVDKRIRVLTKSGVDKNRVKNHVKNKQNSRKVSSNKPLFFKIIFNIIKRIIKLPFPDGHRSYMYHGIKWALMTKEKYHVVIGSVRPPSNAVIAYFYSLLKNATLIIEYRDLWYGQEFQESTSLMVRGINKIYERIILKRASLIVCVSPAYIRTLKSRHPVISNKFKLITNGFSEQYFKFAPKKEFKNKKDYTTIAHFGRFYGPRKIDELLNSLSELTRKIEFLHFGPDILNSTLDLDQINFFKQMGYLSFADSWRLQQDINIDVLFLIEYTSDNIPGKVFEYYASNKPIIIICPNKSVLREIFVDVEQFYFIDNLKMEEIGEVIEIIMMKKANKTIIKRKMDLFLRDKLYERYYEHIKKLKSKG